MSSRWALVTAANGSPLPRRAIPYPSRVSALTAGVVASAQAGTAVR